ncbi:SusC/RagA family TonB-linked outer membrane protein [Bacteroidota bacterium]
MKKMSTSKACPLLERHKKFILLIMKQSLILGILFFSITASSFSQKITLELGKVKLSKALMSIKKEANVDFFYSNNELDVNRVVTVNYKDTDIKKIVSDLIGTNFDVEKTADNIMLITPAKKKYDQNKISIKGKVTDENGEALPGVTIYTKETRQGTISNLDGDYYLTASPTATLVYSYIGFATKEVSVKGRSIINVTLIEDVAELEETVITGIVRRKKESFTGAVKTVTQEELRNVGNTNLIESLKSLDPSFLVIENNVMGSNPNVLPQIELRGQTSLTTTGVADEFGGNPNQPLFILDGFETSLRTIVDLDMNRVASMTLLKDAASTAMYGARAANGVVVVETIRPKAGELRVNYTGDFRIESPDFSDYNLMNSEEKLEFELLSGRWTAPSYDPSAQYRLDVQYNERLAEIRRGVDTYWLNKPTQVGTTLGHSLFVEGGNENLTFGVGLNYKKQEGVMIGSDRETWGAQINLTYRKDKLNITNALYLNGYDANASPYGSFSNFTQTNPYYRLTDENGDITRFLDRDTQVSLNIVNPLFNSTLNSTDNTGNFSIQNNLRAVYRITNEFRIQTNLQLRKAITTTKTFLAPEHTNFLNRDLFEKGSYSNTRLDISGYSFNAMATFSKIVNDDHNISANIRAEAGETRKVKLGFSALGYPAGTNGNPAFAFGFREGSRPTTAHSIYREINVLASANYAYKRKYLLDLNYRLDGSTTFGKNEKFSPFWSVGLGWNLNNEFDMDTEQVQMFKLRGSIGTTGNQGFGSLASTSIYGFNQNINVFGQGVNLISLANPDLKWQNTLNSSLGLDVAFFKNRFTGTFNYFNKTTDPLVVAVDLPSSTGVFGYPINTGNLVSKGAEVILKYSPIFNLEDRIVWTLSYTASMLTNTFDDFKNTLKSLNDSQLSDQTLQRYRDGFSPDDLWAVPSLGIDPASGKEVFLTKEGLQTFEYDINNETVMGNSRPDVEGVISSNLRIKNFSMGINVRYRIGADKFNFALYEKVENIDRNGLAINQDARALTDRWINPGDISRFKGISLTDETPISSRFIQTENELIGESINLGYDFSEANWVRKMGLSSLKVKAFTNNIFRLSTIRVERGTSYPFARNVSFSLNASF